MSPPTTATDRVPRGLPQEQPVEVVAVSSRIGRWALALLAALVLIETVRLVRDWNHGPILRDLVAQTALSNRRVETKEGD